VFESLIHIEVIQVHKTDLRLMYDFTVTKLCAAFPQNEFRQIAPNAPAPSNTTMGFSLSFALYRVCSTGLMQT